MTIIGTKILWGSPIENKPVLPPGFRYIEEKDCWLIAESPDGEQYFVGKEPPKLYPRRPGKPVIDL